MADEPRQVGSADPHAQKILETIEQGPVVLTKYVFVAEGMDEQGRRAIYSASMDNIGITDEIGLIKYALGKLEAQVLIRTMHEQGVL